MRIRAPLFKTLVDRLYGPLVRRYLTRERRYRFRGVSVIVPPGIFHPGLFFSTKVLIRHLDRIAIEGKDLLELGAGSGLISIIAARRGARVTATDINPEAVRCVERNAARAGVRIDVIESDLFEKLPGRRFDLIFVNPPYFPEDPVDMNQRAWLCGRSFGYLERLFPEIPGHLTDDGRCLMVLSELCRVDAIRAIAERNGLSMVRVVDTVVLRERNFVYELRASGGSVR